MPDLSLWAPDDYVSTHGAGAFRPLRKRDPFMHGADVYALQTALKPYRAEIAVDGVFGPQTDKVVEAVQTTFKLIVDGVAGGVTQKVLAAALAKSIGPVFGLPSGIPLGHVQQESSGVLGQYTAAYTSGDAAGSRDEGVVQCNTRFFEPVKAFDAIEAIEALSRKVKEKHAQYAALVADARAWELACGSWNAPAWTDALARGSSLSPANRARIETYIENVTAFASL